MDYLLVEKVSAPLVRVESGKDEAKQNSLLVGRIHSSRPLLLAPIGLC